MGRGRCEVFDESMHNRAVARLKLEAELNDAIDGRQLSLYYQPVIRLATGHLAGFEALLRWNHPDRGATSPYCFLEAAEATGVTLSMGKFAIAETCRQVSDWSSHYPEIKELGVAINLSPKQFADPDLICHIRNAIGDHRLPASSLQVELTENVLTADPSATVQVLHSLKQLGLRILIDDFGVGHLPLAHLAKFAVDAVKIDRSLIAGMLVDRATLKMVDAIITLVHKLKLEAVAKGVEKAAQLEQLMAMGCDLGQGFLFSQPLTAEACNHILSGRLSRAPISEG
jgi:EAL domain-containing protein (putative c-di-GMP-specific phosphodiesterase class I)